MVVGVDWLIGTLVVVGTFGWWWPVHSFVRSFVRSSRVLALFLRFVQETRRQGYIQYFTVLRYVGYVGLVPATVYTYYFCIFVWVW